MGSLIPLFDYFTAVDDCVSEDNTGAGHLGTVEFNSSTLYRYAMVNVGKLQNMLGEKTPEAVRAFADAFIRCMPTGKQNTFANWTRPDAVYVTVRRDQPVNMAGAFEKPVRAGAQGYVANTAHPEKGSAYITNRYYLADAVFVAGLESEDGALLDKIGEALASPAFPLYLGRRSCPPTGRVFLGTSHKPLEEALRENAPPSASRLVLDARAGEPGGLQRDVPLPFDLNRREYGFRRVYSCPLHSAAEHDPMAELEE